MYAGRPSVCRNCGALVGAGESACAVCGSPAGVAPPPQRQENEQQQRSAQPMPDPETLRFARAVLTRPSTFTFVFLALNVFIFLLMSFSVPGGAENPQTLLIYGAKYNALIDQGEWWRFITPVFLHVGGLHLFVNMYSLFILGPYVEKLYGSAKFVFFWIATGVAGVAASYLSFRANIGEGALRRFLAHDPSAGASGALFGLIGVLFVFGIKFRHELPEGFKRAFGTGMIPTILINLFIGFAIPYIDNAAHLGGFIAGAFCALFVGYKRPGQRASVAVLWHVLQVAALILVVVGFGEVARHMGDARPAHAQQVSPVIDSATLAAVNSYIDAINGGRAASVAAINDGNVEGVEGALAALNAAPHLTEESDKLRDEMKLLLARARDYAPINQKKQQTQKEAAQGKQLLADIKAWDERYVGWVKTEGEKNYGLTVGETPAPSATPGEEERRDEGRDEQRNEQRDEGRNGRPDGRRDERPAQDGK